MNTRIYDSDGSLIKKEIPAKATYIGICLDKSGSMEEMIDSTLSGFNEWIQTIKHDAKKGGKTKVTLITFGGNINFEFRNLNPLNIRPLTGFAYKPQGNTPLNDAIGSLLDDLEEYDSPNISNNNAFLIIIISDGKENASRLFTQTTIADRISKLKETGRWTFAYIGANQDVYEVAKMYGFQPYKWFYTISGTSETYDELISSTTNYFALREDGMQSSTSFFSPDNITLTTSGNTEEKEP